MIPKTDIPGLRGKSLRNPGMVFHETGAPHPCCAGASGAAVGTCPAGQSLAEPRTPGGTALQPKTQRGRASGRRCCTHVASGGKRHPAATTHPPAGNAAHQEQVSNKRNRQPALRSGQHATKSRQRPHPATCFDRHLSTGRRTRRLTPRPFWGRRRARGSAWESRSCPSNSRNGRCCPATNATGAWHARA